MYLVSCIATLFTLTVGVLICHLSPTWVVSGSVRTVRTIGALDEVTVVPRKSIYSSTEQESALYVRSAINTLPETTKTYDILLARARAVGPSNIFFVRGRDLSGAISKTVLA